jgi:NodT family efflux transporter outer membrane factor (OMF) lipoprotein
LIVKKTIRSSLAVLTAVALSSCAVGPDFVRPATPPTPRYTSAPLPDQTASAEISGGDAQRFLAEADVPGQWWTQFGSPELNALVEEALRNNPNVAAAQATLNQFEQFVRVSRGALLPQINGTVFDGRQAFSDRSPFEAFSIVLNMNFVLDVFGGIRRSIESAGAGAEFQRFQLEATYLQLISNVLTTAIATATLSAQIAAINDIIAAQSMQLDLLNQQFELGAVARGDVLAQQSQLAVTQAQLPNLGRQLAFARNALAVLQGGTPATRPIPAIDLASLKLPQDIPVSVPSKLVEQRPDVRASEALLHQASAQVGVATAAMLPTFSLTGSVERTVDDRPQLLTPSNYAWAFAGNVVQPLFRGGSLLANRRAAAFNYDRANALYRGAVLSAFADVANVLTALQFDAELLRAQLYAEESARQSFEITLERFQAGAIAYIALLDSQRVYQQTRINLVTAQANRYNDTVALFSALGGGWWNRQDTVQVSSAGSPASP